MIDLDALRKVVERATGWGWEAAYRQDVTALVAEVEQLRGGVERERAAVVEWLRDEAYLTLYEASPWDISDLIERGEHRPKGVE